MIPRRKIFFPLSYLTIYLELLFRVVLLRKKQSYISVFEDGLRKYLQIKNIKTTSSGREALSLGLQAIGHQKGDEIIVPAYTLGELIIMLKSLGLKIIIVDIEADTLNIDANKISAKITPKTKFILATHIFGTPCNMNQILTIAKQNNINVIEDCAHALGATINAKSVGHSSAFSIFSFGHDKTIATFGGGAFATNNQELFKKINPEIEYSPKTELLISKKLALSFIESILLNSPFYILLNKILFSSTLAPLFNRFYRKLQDKGKPKQSAYSQFQALIGMQQLNQITSTLEAKKNLHRKYLEGLDLTDSIIPIGVKYGTFTPQSFPILVKKRSPQNYRKHFQKSGIDIAIAGEILEDCSKFKKNRETDSLLSTYVYNHIIQIPFNLTLKKKEIKKIVDTFNDI